MAHSPAVALLLLIAFTPVIADVVFFPGISL